MVTLTVKSRTRASIVTPFARGKSAGTNRTKISEPQRARRKPITLPTTASTALSVNNRRTSWLRAAPSAARTARSRCRAAARASERLARLAHAINRSAATAPRIVISIGRTFPTISSLSGSTVTPVLPTLPSGNLRRISC
jgi:hypothetical protein